jgi:ureidoacrylate peracid hydrolase
MHNVRINPEVEAKIRARRGGDTHVFHSLDPKKTALVVIDLQDGFMDPKYPTAVAKAPSVVPNVNRLAAALREKGGTVVWVYMTFDDSSVKTWSTFLTEFATPQMRAGLIDSMGTGRPGLKLWHALDVKPDDPIVQKKRFSAFIPGSSDIDALLKSRGIDTIVITGTLTNVCCESTARDASMMNYRTVFLSDGTAAPNDELHNATLTALIELFCDIMTTDECIARLGASRAAAAE